jgi:hypothetical protein
MMKWIGPNLDSFFFGICTRAMHYYIKKKNRAKINKYKLPLALIQIQIVIPFF